MRPLPWLRIEPYRIEVDEIAVEFGFFPRPQRLHGQHALAHQFEAGIIAGAVILHLLDVPATTDTEDETAAGELIEACDRLCGADRLVLRHQENAGAEPEAARRRCG